jgi:hypothetical protein
MWGVWAGFIYIRIGVGEILYENKELSGFIQGEEFLHQLSECKLFMKDISTELITIIFFVGGTR